MSILQSFGKKKSRLQTVSDFINVQDIDKQFLYTKDDKIFAYLKLQPMTLDLLSTRDYEGYGKCFHVL